MARITGGHAIIYSKNADADRAFLRDVMRFPYVDAGGGWLIFALPPSEVALHPSQKNNHHEFYLMCDDIKALTAELRSRKVACSPIQNRGWGLFSRVSLPGGGKLGVYEPLHPRPRAKALGKRTISSTKKVVKSK
jgi:hypothetical protein